MSTPFHLFYVFECPELGVIQRPSNDHGSHKKVVVLKERNAEKSGFSRFHHCPKNRAATLGTTTPSISNTQHKHQVTLTPGNTKGGRITVLLTSCLTGLD